MFMKQTVTYKKKTTPTLSFTNHVGAVVSTLTGTPTQFGVWRLSVYTDEQGIKHVTAINEYTSDFKDRTVQPSMQVNDLVPGVTITLGATLNDGDYSDIEYLDVVVDSVP